MLFYLFIQLRDLVIKLAFDLLEVEDLLLQLLDVLSAKHKLIVSELLCQGFYSFLISLEDLLELGLGI